tara:strand:+ start:1852 stop:2694 length:843 start_codon:yes stop_codon:yes gene_type:complete
MYNFNFSSREYISLDDKINLLLSIKSLLPRYLNSIPDFEFICISNLLYERGKKVIESGNKPVFVETGCGASTIAFCFFAIQFNGIAYTWDSNVLKISEIRKVLNESLGVNYGLNIDDSWKPVQHLSNSKTVGINILKELNKKIDLFMHDSEHTHSTLLSELKLVLENSNNIFDCLIDDSHYKFKDYDYAYSNLMRAKLNLSSVYPEQGEEGVTMKEAAINFFNRANINYLDLNDKIANLTRKYQLTNHLEQHSKILNVTGNEDSSKSLTEERFAAFTLNK